MNSISNIIKFYRECYLKDYKTVNILNFFSSGVEHQYYLNSFELFNGKLPDYPVDSEWGKIIDEELILNSKEKELYAGVFFIKGKMSILGKDSKVFAPLYLYEANLKNIDNIYSIEVNLENPLINPAFFNFLKLIDSNIDISFDSFVENFPKGVLNFDSLILIKNRLKAIIPSFEIDAFENLLNSNNNENNLKSIYQSRSKKYDLKIFASSSIGLVKKPKGSRGVINELDLISKKEINNGVLKSMFFDYTINTKKKNHGKKSINVPVSLSESQKEVFYSLDKYNVTLVIGPPGTGKSFTISALAADLISTGKSVLIASKNNQAGRVISNKIENDFKLKGLVIKTANKSYKRSLKTRLINILNGIEVRKVNEYLLKKLENEIEGYNRAIKRCINLLNKRGKKEVELGYFFYNYKATFFNNVKKNWILFRYNSRQPIWKIKNRIEDLEKVRIRKIIKFIKDNYIFHLYKNLLKKRNQINDLIKALDENAGNLIQQEFDKIDFNLLLNALPAWIVNTSDIHRILPLKEELFDVVIIDEATQCDIASTIPLLYRAKKIVVVGDPKQLRHISFVSKFQEKVLRKKYNLDNDILSYRDNSILDLLNNAIQNQEQVIFLNEHYRSSPDIISFSNKRFYAERLKVMTASPISNVKKTLFLKKIAGKRNEKSINLKEAQYVVLQIKRIVEKESVLEKKLCKSIGVISPFRSQVSQIKVLIRESIQINNIKRHNILIGTPYHFQGEERDIIFLSFVLDNDSHHSSLTYLNREDVFNVSITRARNKQIVITSLDYKTLDRHYLLSNYLNSINCIRENNREIEEIQDGFAEEIIKYFESELRSAKVFKNYPVAGVDIDIVVVYRGKTFCFDLVGYPGVFAEQFKTAKIKMLNRMNHPVFFIAYSSWFLKRDNCKKQIKQFIIKNK